MNRQLRNTIQTKAYRRTRRYPTWTRDELIMALDLYFRIDPLRISEKHPEVVKLSKLLNDLASRMNVEKGERFRSPDAVHMKLCNFLRLDPSYKGKGLFAGSKLDKDVWDEFSHNRQYLSSLANIIGRNYHLLPSSPPFIETIDSPEAEFPEGRTVAHIHTMRERNRTAIRKKKSLTLKHYGKLICEACGFDFAEYYGQLGYGTAECHHNVPLTQLDEERRIRLSDLSIICANCHRVIHKVRPWLTVQALKEYLVFKGKSSTVGLAKGDK